MPLHIAIDARRIRDFGIGTYIRSLVHALSKIDHENRYTLISSAGDVRTLAGLPENFHAAVYSHSDRGALDHLTFPLFLHGIAPDLVHIPLNRVPLLLMRPYVVTVHDMANLLFEESRSGAWMQLRRYRFRRGLLRARRVIAVSEATKRDVQNLMGVPSERIRRVYNAPDPGFYEHDGRSADERGRILERYQIQHPFLLYAGNVRRHKNVPRLVEAFAVLRGQLADHPVYKDLRLVLIGDTISQHPAVRQAIMKSRMEPLVRFLGFVPFETLRCFYESAAAFVFPSRYEGFGLPPLEAMAHGTPVLTSNVSSMPEVFNEAALLVNPENVFDIARGIRQILTENVLRQTLRRRGYERAQMYSWETAARLVHAAYQSVLRRTVAA